MFAALGEPGRAWPDLIATCVEGQKPVRYDRGRGVGVSSAVNATVAIRGLPSDYDRWAATGATGWGWNDVRPAFDRVAEHIPAERCPPEQLLAGCLPARRRATRAGSRRDRIQASGRSARRGRCAREKPWHAQSCRESSYVGARPSRSSRFWPCGNHGSTRRRSPQRADRAQVLGPTGPILAVRRGAAHEECCERVKHAAAYWHRDDRHPRMGSRRADLRARHREVSVRGRRGRAGRWLRPKHSNAQRMSSSSTSKIRLARGGIPAGWPRSP